MRRIRFGISSKLLAAPVLLILLLATVGGLSYFASDDVLTALGTLSRRSELAQGAQEIQTEMLRQATAIRNYILFGRQEDVTELEAAGQQLNARLDHLIETAAVQSTREQLEAIRADQISYRAAVEKIKTQVQVGSGSEAGAILQSEAGPILDHMTQAATALVEQLNENAAAGLVEAQENTGRMQAIIFSVTGFAVVAGVLVALVVARTLVKPLMRLAGAVAKIAAGDLTVEPLAVTTTDEIGAVTHGFNEMTANLRSVLQRVSQNAEAILSVSGQLSEASVAAAQAAGGSAQAISQVAAGASEQSHATAEVNAAVNQLRASIQQIADGAGKSAAEVQDAAAHLNQMAEELDGMAAGATDTARMAGAAAQRAQAGAGVVERTLDEIQEIGAAVIHSAERITELEALSGRIGAITDAIADLAGQTNLLALNAAIEAARAGEHGRGFAVVAEEVRKLAERSATSTREITGLIGSIQTATADAVKAMNAGTERVAVGNQLASEAGQALQEILAEIQRAAGAMEGIARAAQQVKQVSAQAVQTFNDVAALTEESSAATEEMAAGAAEVTEGMHRIARVSQENAASAEEVSASIEELTASSEQVASSAQGLAQTAQELQEQVRRFTI